MAKTRLTFFQDGLRAMSSFLMISTTATAQRTRVVMAFT